jgi:hypothetical protein
VKIKLLLLVTALTSLYSFKGYGQKQLYVIDHYDSLHPKVLNTSQIISVNSYLYTYRGKIISFNDSTLTMFAYYKGRQAFDSIIEFQLDSIHSIIYCKLKDTCKLEKMRRKGTYLTKFWNFVFKELTISLFSADAIGILSQYTRPGSYAPAHTVATVAIYGVFIGAVGLVYYIFDYLEIKKIRHIDLSTELKLKVK